MWVVGASRFGAERAFWRGSLARLQVPFSTPRFCWHQLQLQFSMALVELEIGALRFPIERDIRGAEQATAG